MARGVVLPSDFQSLTEGRGITRSETRLMGTRGPWERGQAKSSEPLRIFDFFDNYFVDIDHPIRL
jgi:hypothetical protein